MLNQEQINWKWDEIKSGIRNLWGRVSNDELELVKENVFEIIFSVEEKYGETKEEIIAKLNKLFASFDNDTDKNITPDISSFGRSPIETEKPSKH